MTETPRLDGFGQPIGAALPDWAPPPAPPHVPLDGRHGRLEPLAPVHADALHAAYGEAPDTRAWTYLSDEWEPDRHAFAARVAERAASADPLDWAVVVGGEPLGGLALMRIDPRNGVIEIGHVHFAPRLQRTAAATKAVVLLACHAFALGYRRLEWKCDSLNAPSRRSATRYGFALEGIFRNAVVVKGRNRDTAWYAMTDADWRAVAPALALWLAPENFDASGRQIVALARFKGADA